MAATGMTFADPFTEAMYRALVELGDDIHKLPSLYENWKHEIYNPNSRERVERLAA